MFVLFIRVTFGFDVLPGACSDCVENAFHDTRADLRRGALLKGLFINDLLRKPTILMNSIVDCQFRLLLRGGIEFLAYLNLYSTIGHLWKSLLN